MKIDEKQARDIGIALNESQLLGLEVDPIQRLAAATFQVLTLSENDVPPSDRRVQIIFSNVGRCAISYKDRRSLIAISKIDDLLKIVQGFEGQDIYGWEFINRSDAPDFSQPGTFSLDWREALGSVVNSIWLFQGAYPPSVDIWLWFEDLYVYTPTGKQISLDEFCVAGRRWWDAFARGKASSENYGLHKMPPSQV